MTGVQTCALPICALPLAFSTGAGGESRAVIGTVVVFGVLWSTALTLYIVPVIYLLLARYTGSPEARSQQIEAFERQEMAIAAE